MDIVYWCGEKLLRQFLGWKLQGVSGKAVENSTGHMSIKVYFLRSHLDEFPDNCSDASDEQKEWFHQDIKTMEEHYQGQWDK